MKKTIAFLEQEVGYTLRMSSRARRMRLAIYPDGELVVTAPRVVDENLVEQFIRDKARWIVEKLKNFRTSPAKTIIKVGRNGFWKYKDQAFLIVQERIEYFNQIYQFRFNNISIRNQKTRWASCSKKGNLSFNYKIALLPRRLADYIIVHELCHLAEFNHSRKFWDQMARTVPNYRELRTELKRTLVQA